MYDAKIAEGVDAIVVALCSDYERRRRAIEEHTVNNRTDAEYKYYNFKIFDAVAEVIGERYVNVFINEIGKKIGYAKSEINFMSEVTYKKYKYLIKENIAKKLHLID